jgi:hypothetical protein
LQLSCTDWSTIHLFLKILGDRTQVQHEWAITVERVGGRIGADLKSGHGPQEVLGFFEEASRAMAIEESGGTPSEALVSEVRRLRSRAEASMGRM